jgi:hypothetical protein
LIGRVEGPGGPNGPGDPDAFHDDLLVTLLRPEPEALPMRPGSFDSIRRGATRRRRIRAALGGGLVAAAVAVALPTFLAGSPRTNTVPVTPLAPSGVSARHSPTPRPTATPTPSVSTLRAPTQAVPSARARSWSAATATPTRPTASSSDSSGPTPARSTASAPSLAEPRSIPSSEGSAGVGTGRR